LLIHTINDEGNLPDCIAAAAAKLEGKVIVFLSSVDHVEKCAAVLEHLKRYRRAINRTTNQPGAPLHDEHSHCADGVRYLSVCIDQMGNEIYTPPPVMDVISGDSVVGY
jgi:hypothetical protein